MICWDFHSIELWSNILAEAFIAALNSSHKPTTTTKQTKDAHCIAQMISAIEYDFML